MIGAGVVVLALAGWLIFGRGEDFVGMTEKAILGQWQSVETEMLVREFKEDGVVTDWYAGEAVMSGTWDLFDASEAPKKLFVSSDEEAVYLRLTLTGEEKDAIYFSVKSIDADNLELSYVESKGSLSFTRVGAEVGTEEAE